MNKKFSTLLASAFLASAFSANAQFTDAVKKDARFLLQAGTEYVSVGNGNNNFGQLSSKAAAPTSLKDANLATWKVTAVRTTLGKTIYSFVNPATGLALAVDPASARYYNSDNELKNENSVITLGGDATEWIMEGSNLVSYGSDYVVSIAKDSNGEFYAAKAKDLATLNDKFTLVEFKDADLNAVGGGKLTLTAEDLNTLLQSVPNNKVFALTMNPEVSKDYTNILTSTGLTAQTIEGSEFVNLKVADKKYVVVDTAYYAGTETADKFLKFGYDKLNAENRLPESYNFKFTYNLVKDELYIQAEKVAHKAVKGNASNDAWKDFLKKTNNSVWQGTSVNGTEGDLTLENMYIYMAGLDKTKLLTLNTKESAGTLTEDKVQRTVVKLGADFSSMTMTTIPDGVYTIQFKASEGNPKYNQNGAYALANLAGTLGWAEQAERQNFDHMPAAQWVVKKNGTSSTATVNIINREFLNNSNSVIREGAIQFFKLDGSDAVYCFSGSVSDTLVFHKVADELVKDNKLGYKYVSENDAKVQSYTFNYLHGLADDKFLVVEENGVVKVDAKDGKSAFRLEVFIANDHYGYDDALVRNVYYVTDGSKYLSYDNTAKKYMMGKNPTPFFLKENNCVDGKHFYTLVTAYYGKYVHADNYAKIDGADNLYIKFGDSYYQVEQSWEEKGQKKYQYQIGFFVADASEDSNSEYYVQKGHDFIKATSVPDQLKKKVTCSPADYATVKVSVDDNTLDLTEGNLNDKFIFGNYNEIRTSAFAVETDDSPLYRRFNNANLGEVEGTDSLMFVEKTRGEYLMDESNVKLQHTTVDYAGIWNKDKAEGKLAFIVDTAWVNRGLGYIKPQYLISVARNDQKGTETIPCTYEHNHYDNAGNKVDAAHCSHATKGHDGFRYGKYLVSFGDSAIANKLETPYMDVKGGYTRVGFVEAIHYNDSLIILTGEYEKADPAKLNVEDIIAAYKKAKKENLIVDLTGDNHKNVTWSFRYVTPSTDAVKATEEGAANEFLFESNIYDENGNSRTYDKYVDNDQDKGVISLGGKATKGFSEAVKGSIAPAHAAWLKMQNGCLVLTRGDSKFEAAKTGSDGALIFNAYKKSEADDMVTSNDEVAVEGVKVLGANGSVVVLGAAGKNVTVATVLGKTVASQVIASDNATIAAPAGVVFVTVDGETTKVVVK